MQDWDALILFGFTLAAWPIGSAISGPVLLYTARRRSLQLVCLSAMLLMAAGSVVYGSSPSVVATVLGRFICGLGGGMSIAFLLSVLRVSEHTALYFAVTRETVLADH